MRIMVTGFPQVAALALVSALLCSAASANPALLKEARQMMAAGNAKAAYMLLVKEQDSLAGDSEFDYLLGVASLDSGKIDESIIAFERVLAVNPRNAGAELDLGRAYFIAGSLDLAQATFTKLRASSPPPAALAAIDRHLAAIEQKRQADRRVFNVWGETTLGYDSNLTTVTNDFSRAVEQAFNIPGVSPTGNSIKRSAPFFGAGLGADLLQPFGKKWNGTIGAEVRGRGYRKEPLFNSGSGEARAGLQYAGDEHQWRVHVSASRFTQKGATPKSIGSPDITNDRRNATLGTEYRVALPGQSQLSLGLAGAQSRFFTNPTEDYNSAVVHLGLLKAFKRGGDPIMQLSTFYSRDKALRLLADGITDKSKKLYGVRVYGQFNFTERLAPFFTVGGLLRRDDNPFARATEVADGRDKLVDLALGVNWRFQEKCNMRAQWAAARNDSSIALFNYVRHEVSSNIRCDF